MEAATPLPFSSVHVRNGRLAIDSLVVDDQCAVRQAAERGDPARFVVEAIEIGARVLDREQAATDTDFVKLEFERTARELNQQFTERATKVADRLDQKVEEAFGAEHGHVARVLARHFGDESTGAVQHRVKAVLDDVAKTMREDLRKQLTSDTTDNPIVAIQRSSLQVIRDSTTAQNEALVAMTGKLEALKLQVSELRAEKQRLEDVSAAESRGTAKGRTYEEAVFEALDTVATSRGDGCEALGDLRGDDGKKGDVLVSVDACAGPARGRIVFEAKDAQNLSRPKALDYLDRALANRGADYAVLVMPSADNLPARSNPLREINGDKLFVTFDAEEGSTLALEVAYSLARARVLMARDAEGGLDTGAVRAEVERAIGALEEVKRIKTQLTHAQNGVKGARDIVEALESGVKAHLTAINVLLDAQ
jgi:polyhydroxyalkanoate synthesis regulator phasin